MQYPAHFISIEGGEGSGKSTQAQRLAQWLQQQGLPSLVTREPGGTPNGEAIRALFVRGAPDRWDALCELYLLNAARRDHVLRVIKPALAAGVWVICDRFVDSTRVYQGFVKGLDDALILRHHYEATENLWPDTTLILDIDPALGLARAQQRIGQASDLAAEMRFETEAQSFHQRLRDGFQRLARAEPKRCLLIDAAQTPEQVFQSLTKALQPFLPTNQQQ
jgi:dTMP kinase